ncbi:MAG TPA: hypothetical protein VI998_01800 [Patescibacteria group bacterium]|nr:hypothetical protein [Patescibacteria group bacterium]
MKIAKFAACLIVVGVLFGCVTAANEDTLKRIASGEGKVLATLHFYDGGAYSLGVFAICDNSDFVTGMKITYRFDGTVLIDKTPLFISSTGRVKCSRR